MARSGGLLGGGGNSPLDIYGDLFTDEQKQALQQRELSSGLLRFAEKLGAASAPSRAPKGSFLGLLGQSLGGLAPTGEGEERALKGMHVAEQVRSARQERAILAKAAPMVEAIASRLIQAGVPAAQATAQATQIVGGGATQAAPEAPAGQPPSATAADAPASPIGGAAEPWAGSVASQGLQWRSGLPWGINSPPQSSPQPLLPIPPAPPGGRVGPADYGGGGPQTGLLPPPPGANPQMGGGLLAGLPFDQTAPGTAGGLPDLGQFQVELLSGQAAPADKTSPEYLARRARDLDLTQKYESGGRNIMQQVVGPQGGYNPSVGRVTGPSSASGYFQMIDPTYRHAAKLAGIDISQWPRAMDAPPQVQRKLAEALYDEQGNRPWDPYNKPLAAARGGGGLPDVGRVRIDPLGGEAAPAGQGGIAGTGVSPEELAALNAMLKMGGLKSDPFGSLLETYYKSPGYLAEKARTEAKAAKDVALEMDPLIAQQTETAKAKVEFEWKPKIQEAVEKLQSPILDERNKAKADIDRVTEELKLDKTAALTPTKATVFGPDGVLGTQDMTVSEFVRRQQDRAKRIAKGNTTLQPGDVVPTPTGNLPPGYQHRMTPEGTLVTGAVPNTPAAREEAAATEKDRLSKAQKQTSTDFVVNDIDRIRQKVQASPFTTTGVVGGWLSGINQTDAGAIRNMVEGIESNIMLDRMLALKAASPTGATGMGSLTEKEGERLVKAYGSLKQSQDTPEFLYNLDRVQRLYLEFVHGPAAAQEMMSNRPEVAGPGAAKAAAPTGAPADPARAAYDRLPSGATYTAPDGTQRTKK